MVKKIFEVLSCLQSLHKQNSKSHSYLQDIITRSLNDPAPVPNKLLIEISLFEEIATLITSLTKTDHKLDRVLITFSSLLKSCVETVSPLSDMKLEFSSLKSFVLTQTSDIQNIINQIFTVQKEYKTRCQSYFIDYLKGIDIDLRKILKPLVPSSVIKEQIKFPEITTHSSLKSSVHSIGEFEPPAEEEMLMSHPDPGEVTIQKLNSHIQMLVTTLEGVAKDLIQILTEANREYYQMLNMQDKFSRPPTPLAAPLPDYFCYEVQESPETSVKPIITSESKILWVKRLKKLKKGHNLTDRLYKSLIFKLKKNNEKKIDLKELFNNEEISVEDREGIVYYLINGSTQFDKHVSLSEIMSEKKIIPEPPKHPKPKNKILYKVENSDKRLSPDQEIKFLNPSGSRVANSIRLMSKSPKIERLLKGRKSVRVRSTTPVGKEKSGKRMPSVQKSLGTIQHKHRIRRNYN